jgi:hypothetical protein
VQQNIVEDTVIRTSRRLFCEFELELWEIKTEGMRPLGRSNSGWGITLKISLRSKL